jgi:O-6-methylguanine DNA methyltransferase
MKNLKNIKIGRISLQVDSQNDKILEIGLHSDCGKDSVNQNVPKKFLSAAKALNDGYSGKEMMLSLDLLDLTNMKPFQRNILLTLYNKVPKGKVITYGKLAALAGHPGAARAVGTAMSSNPFPMILPCHRVVPSSGHIGRFGSGPEMKKKLLKAEGITFDSSGKINLCHFIKPTP